MPVGTAVSIFACWFMDGPPLEADLIARTERQQGPGARAALRQNAAFLRTPTFRCGAPAAAETTGLSRRPALLARCRHSISEISVPYSQASGRLDPAGADWAAQIWTANVAQSRHARRQVRPDQEPRLRHRLSGAGAPDDDAARARQARRPQYRGLRHRLPRLAARRSRLPVPARGVAPRAAQHAVPDRHQRGPCRDRAMGL